jgi:hypothetical protein
MEERIRLAPVAAYNSQLEADLVAARLGAAGIRAFVKSDGLGGTFPGMPMATGGFQVMVAEADQEKGRAIVVEMGGQAIDRTSGALEGPGWRLTRLLMLAAIVAIVVFGLVRSPL